MASSLFNPLSGPYRAVSAESEIVPLFDGPEPIKAVALADPDPIDPALITNLPGYQDSGLFWEGDNGPADRRIPGRTKYLRHEITPEVIESEARDAGLNIAPEALPRLQQKFQNCMDTYGRTVAGYTGRDDFFVRLWMMFAPEGGQGRTPFLHFDWTYLTGLYYLGRAPLQIYEAPLSEDMWKTFERHVRAPGDSDAKLREEVRLRTFTASTPSDHVHNGPLAHLIITRQPKGLDLSNPWNRANVCLHGSSPKIVSLGQAAIVMTPEFSVDLHPRDA